MFLRIILLSTPKYWSLPADQNKKIHLCPGAEKELDFNNFSRLIYNTAIRLHYL